MLLFQKRFHEGLKNGSITLTFRQWDRPRVKVGGRYRVHPLGVLEVDTVDRVLLGEVTQHDVRRAGFDSLDAFRDYVRHDGEVPGDDLPLIRIGFHHGGDGDRVPEALNASLTDEEVATIVRKLSRLDKGRRRRWTAPVLELISKHPQRRAGDLADFLGREKLDFKADVVKLKKLGLTQSFEVGYGLTPRGAAFLERSQWLAKAMPASKRAAKATTKAVNDKKKATPSKRRQPPGKRRTP